MTPEERFEKLGLKLPPAAKPMGVYKNLLVDGKTVMLSGHGPQKEDGTYVIGRVGKDLDQKQAVHAAQLAGLSIIATIKANLGSLNKVKRVLSTLGMVNCVSDFQQHPTVINGCSELFAEIWGKDDGVGVRSAVGMGSLPNNIPVEIEATFELH